MPVIGSTSTVSGLGDAILEIRDLIPDPVSDPSQDGAAFSLATLLRFFNHACEELCQNAPVITDWYGIQSEQGMDVYQLPNYIVAAEQLWYDLWPCWRSPEYNAIFTTKISSRSYFFGPHASHQIPKIHVWPCADRTGANTTLSGILTDSTVIIPLTSTSGFKPYGMMQVDDEIMLYRTVDSALNQIRQVLRGQGGTLAVPHAISAPVKECNIMMKVTRLPRAVTKITDPIEVPQGLMPIIETGVLSHVRLAEQEFQEAARLGAEFDKAVQSIAAKGNKIRQGTSIRVGSDGPLLYGGRVIVP
jgi:hypothetical protein